LALQRRACVNRLLSVALGRHSEEGSSMGRYTLLLVLGLVLASACWFGVPARTAADKGPSSKPSAAQEIAQAWIPRGEGVGDWHDLGAGCPKDSPKLYVVSFRTSQMTFAEAWEFCATKCGADKKYVAYRLETTAGEGGKGSWALVERPGKDGERIEALFALRSENHSVSVTLRLEDGGKSVSGTLTVVVH
jgi:hypothetical protein